MRAGQIGPIGGEYRGHFLLSRRARHLPAQRAEHSRIRPRRLLGEEMKRYSRLGELTTHSSGCGRSNLIIPNTLFYVPWVIEEIVTKDGDQAATVHE